MGSHEQLNANKQKTEEDEEEDEKKKKKKPETQVAEHLVAEHLGSTSENLPSPFGPSSAETFVSVTNYEDLNIPLIVGLLSTNIFTASYALKFYKHSKEMQTYTTALLEM